MLILRRDPSVTPAQSCRAATAMARSSRADGENAACLRARLCVSLFRLRPLCVSSREPVEAAVEEEAVQGQGAARAAAGFRHSYLRGGQWEAL